MVAQVTREGLAPSMKRRFADVEPVGLYLAEGSDDDMHVGVRLIGMECQGIPTPRGKYGLCKMAHGREEPVGRGSRRHRKDDDPRLGVANRRSTWRCRCPIEVDGEPRLVD
jgi:hypothetical protein